MLIILYLLFDTFLFIIYLHEVHRIKTYLDGIFVKWYAIQGKACYYE